MSAAFLDDAAALERSGICCAFVRIVVELRVDRDIEFEKACRRFEA